MHKRTFYNVGLTLMMAFVTGCAVHNKLDDLLRQHQLHRASISTAQFELMTVAPAIPEDSAALHIYLGGDGRPWVDNQPSADPTGRQPVAIAMMAQDPAPTIYLSRPCYYLDKMPENCQPDLWTSGRYSEPVIATMTEGVERIVAAHGKPKVTLIGYSGGGVIALLIAQRLSPPPRVITVASNLDIEGWTTFHKLQPLEGSINPLDVIPDRVGDSHLIGNRDQVVPVQSISRYIEAHPQASYHYFDGFDHNCCWVENWPDILLTLQMP